jgi:hypothetical protein
VQEHDRLAVADCAVADAAPADLRVQDLWLHRSILDADPPMRAG